MTLTFIQEITNFGVHFEGSQPEWYISTFNMLGKCHSGPEQSIFLQISQLVWMKFITLQQPGFFFNCLFVFVAVVMLKLMLNLLRPINI